MCPYFDLMDCVFGQRQNVVPATVCHGSNESGDTLDEDDCDPITCTHILSTDKEVHKEDDNGLLEDDDCQTTHLPAEQPPRK